jgi:hypothetical protein
MRLFLNLSPSASELLNTLAASSDLPASHIALSFLEQKLIACAVSPSLPPDALEMVQYLQDKAGIERAERMGKVAKRRITILYRIEKIFDFYRSLHVTLAEMTEALGSYVLEAAVLEREAEAQALVTTLLKTYEKEVNARLKDEAKNDRRSGHG